MSPAEHARAGCTFISPVRTGLGTWPNSKDARQPRTVTRPPVPPKKPPKSHSRLTQ